MASEKSLDPLGRFSNRVDDYVRYRPSYPKGLIAFLRAKAGLGPGAAVADIGSGTGIFTRLLLETGAGVLAVEPNDPMREAAEAALSDMPGFSSVKGTAERTGLAAHSVDLITCAQAFHWFDLGPTRAEFSRIARPGGRCALAWNAPITDDSDVARGFEGLKERFGTDFGAVRQRVEDAASSYDSFFGPGAWTEHRFGNFQDLDLAGIVGRFMSSSFAPPPGDPRVAPCGRPCANSLFGAR